MADNQKNLEFLIEAEDIIQRLSGNLKQLKLHSSSSKVADPDLINELFRNMHNLKGISSISGFTRMPVLAHKLEDLLDSLRLDRIGLSAFVVDILHEGTDVLIRLLREISMEGVEHFETEYLMDKIEETIINPAAPGELHAGGLIDAGSDIFNGLSEFEVHRLKESLKNGLLPYKITVSFSIDTVDQDIITTQEKLKKFGEVIALIPATGFPQENGLVFDIIFSSSIEKAESIIGDIPGGNILNIQNMDTFFGNRANQGSSNLHISGSSAESITMAVKVSIDKLDTILNNIGEIFLLNDTIFYMTKDLKRQYGQNRGVLESHKISRELFKRLSSLRNDLIEIRMVPVGYMFDRLALIVERLSKELSKDIKIEVQGSHTKLDKSIIEGLADPLMHIIRNAVDHGIENEATRQSSGKPKTGTVILRASQKDGKVLIEVEDDGAGIDLKNIHSIASEKGLINNENEVAEKKLIDFLFQPGFSTTSTVNEISGRGVGLDIVAKNIAGIGGMIDVDTKWGKGTKFSISLPLTLLVERALIVTEANRCFAIPLNSVSENFIINTKDIKKLGVTEVFNVRGHFIPLLRLGEIMRFNRGTPATSRGCLDGVLNKDKIQRSHKVDKTYIVMLGLAEKRVGIIVDAINGQREILIKPVSELLGRVPCVAGFTEIDSRKILPVIDVSEIIEKHTMAQS